MAAMVRFPRGGGFFCCGGCAALAFCGGRGASGCHRGGRQGARGAARAAMGGLFAVVGEERFWLFAERRSLDGRVRKQR